MTEDEEDLLDGAFNFFYGNGYIEGEESYRYAVDQSAVDWYLKNKGNI